jgi:protein gp37
MSIQDGKYWDESWNPLKDSRGGYHCTKCSPGCANCWAEGINMRAGGKPYDNAKVEFILNEKAFEKITHPKPKMFFVCDLCDLFHKDVSDATIRRVFEAMARHEQHTFLVLTKRPERLATEFLATESTEDTEIKEIKNRKLKIENNLWLGVSVCVESEKHKIDALRKVPAAHRWVSFGPLLGPVDQVNLAGIDWLVMEAESLGGGPGRECKWQWMLSLIHQAKDQGVPVWVKQINYRNRLVKNFDEMPAELKVREDPNGFAQ